MLKKIINVIKKPQLILPCGFYWDSILSIVNMKIKLGYWPNYKNPKSFNEHFLREKIFFSGDIELAKTLTDKIEIKNWLSTHGYNNHIIPTLFTASNIKELQGRLMPSRCVIKPAHSSGDVIIINQDVSRQLNPEELLKINDWLNEDYYRRGREPNYKGLTPRIIVEELMLDDSGQPPKDYKIECAVGVPFIIQVDIDRFNGHVRQLYTPNWDLLPYCTTIPRHSTPQPTPKQLSRALEIARDLSSPFKLCRIDLYFIDEEDIRIGEITFYPANCAEIFQPTSGDIEAGKIIDTIFTENNIKN